MRQVLRYLESPPQMTIVNMAPLPIRKMSHCASEGFPITSLLLSLSSKEQTRLESSLGAGAVMLT